MPSCPASIDAYARSRSATEPHVPVYPSNCSGVSFKLLYTSSVLCPEKISGVSIYFTVRGPLNDPLVNYFPEWKLMPSVISQLHFLITVYVMTPAMFSITVLDREWRSVSRRSPLPIVTEIQPFSIWELVALLIAIVTMLFPRQIRLFPI